jgi:hypothetical protein
MALDPERVISERGCFWLRHIQRWQQQADQTQVSYCRGCELSVSAFRWWRYRLMREGILADKATSSRTLPPESKSFVEISVPEPKQPMAVAPYEIVLSCHRRLLIAENFEDQAVVRLLSILENRC